MVAVNKLAIVQIYMESKRYLLCWGSSYGFGAFGSPSQRSTIRTHLAIVSGGNVAENFAKISECLALINTASSKRLENRLPI